MNLFHDPSHDCPDAGDYRRLYPLVISGSVFRVLWGCRHSVLVDVWEAASSERMRDLLSGVLTPRVVRGLMSRCEKGVVP